MSLYNDLRAVLSVYATKIKGTESDILELQAAINDPAIIGAKNVATALGSLNLCIDQETEPGYLSGSGNILAGDQGERTTGFIAVSAGDIINIRNWSDPGTGTPWFGVGKYDSEKTWISRAGKDGSAAGATFHQWKYTIPEGVSYIRVSARYYGRMMVTKGDFDMAYLPSSADIATQSDIPDIETIIEDIPELANVEAISTVLEELNLCINQDAASGYLTNSGALSGGSSGERTTDYIPVSEGDVINIRNWSDPGTGKLWFCIGKYDSEKVWISRSTAEESAAGATFHQWEYTIPSGVSYIRVSARFYGKMMITRGDFDIAYLPASEDIATKDDLSEIDLDAFKKEASEATGTDWFTDQYSTGYIATNKSTINISNIKDDPAYKHIVVECEANDLFHIYGRGYDSYHGLWAFIQSDGTVIKRVMTATYTEYTPIVAPANTAYLVSNVLISEPYSLVKGELIGTKVAELSNTLGASTGLLNPLLRPAGPKFALHRGVCTQAPENTVPAFTLAGQGGAWAIETDVYETTDGYFILSHDNDVSRMTDGTGTITTMTYAQTQACTIDAGANIEQYPNLKMPTLQEYLSICRRYGCVAFIECKGVTHYEELVQAIKAEGMEGSSVFLLYNAASTIATIRNLTAIPILLIGSSGYDIDDMIAHASAYSDIWLTLYSATITAEHVQKAHSANIPIGPWTIDSDSVADIWFRYGCDYITSNSKTKFTT